jgi:predicted ribosomally synthesized peptide with SipW-like signal peptide
MFNKKMLLSVLIIGVVSLLAGSATWAYFQDTETSDDNTLTAGTLDLTLTNAPFTLTNKEPGDLGTETQTIQNIGSLAGELDVTFSVITNTESTGATEFEADGAPGELGAVAEMMVFIDVDDSTTLTQNDIVLKSDGTVITAPENPVENDYFATINSYGEDDFDAAIASMGSTVERDVLFKWRIPTTSDNTIQGDSVSFDVTFTLEQADVDA